MASAHIFQSCSSWSKGTRRPISNSHVKRDQRIKVISFLIVTLDYGTGCQPAKFYSLNNFCIYIPFMQPMVSALISHLLVTYKSMVLDACPAIK